MKKNLIMFYTMTAVMKSKDLLKKHEIRSRVMKTPQKLRQGSCGYSLLVNNNYEKATEIIKNNKIPIFGGAAVDAL